MIRLTLLLLVSFNIVNAKLKLDHKICNQILSQHHSVNIEYKFGIDVDGHNVPVADLSTTHDLLSNSIQVPIIIPKTNPIQLI